MGLGFLNDGRHRLPADPKRQIVISTGDQIASTAISVASATANAKYASPPVSIHAFDCSYFVWLVIKTINPLYQRESSVKIANDPLRFKLVVGPPRPGDIIYFPPAQVQWQVKRGDRRIYPGHVAIMVSPNRFVGMQSSGPGPQQVDLNNVWWNSRPRQFFRYIGPVGGG
jgi:cell wall-associated NlpC family hydrolase